MLDLHSVDRTRRLSGLSIEDGRLNQGDLGNFVNAKRTGAGLISDHWFKAVYSRRPMTRLQTAGSFVSRQLLATTSQGVI